MQVIFDSSVQHVLRLLVAVLREISSHDGTPQRQPQKGASRYRLVHPRRPFYWPDHKRITIDQRRRCPFGVVALTVALGPVAANCSDRSRTISRHGGRDQKCSGGCVRRYGLIGATPLAPAQITPSVAPTATRE
jgi:hypothetical protein